MLRHQTLGHTIIILVARTLYPTKMITSPVHAGRRQSATVMWSPIGLAITATTAEITAGNIPHFLPADLGRIDRAFQPRGFHPLPHGESVQHVHVDETKVAGTAIH